MIRTLCALLCAFTCSCIGQPIENLSRDLIAISQELREVGEQTGEVAKKQTELEQLTASGTATKEELDAAIAARDAELDLVRRELRDVGNAAGDAVKNTGEALRDVAASVTELQDAALTLPKDPMSTVYWGAGILAAAFGVRNESRKRAAQAAEEVNRARDLARVTHGPGYVPVVPGSPPNVVHAPTSAAK